MSELSIPASEPSPLAWPNLGLSDEALKLIQKAGFEKPTPVQQQAIPPALRGSDLICSAQTGTGKTACFVLPMVEKFVGREGTYGVILSPTREIAQQTQATLEIFGAPRGVRSIVLIGGINMRIDAQALATYPQIIVATPGRLCDHLDRGNIWLDFIEVAVLDEADRMLDMGFSDQLSRIMEDIPKKRQTMLFSATFPPAVERLAQKILHEPERISVGKPMAAASTVAQRVRWMKEEDKTRELHRLIREEKGSIIVFTRSKDLATRVWRQLHSRCVYDATFIHSDRPQDQREQALAEFKEGKFRIMIATDVAARGIHVDGVAHVVNYDLPLEPEDYVHRIGRTGRAEATGHATSFATPRDRGLLRQIERLIGRALPEDFGGQARAEELESDHGSSHGEHRGGGGRDGRGDGRRGGGGRGGASRGGGRRDENRSHGTSSNGSGGHAPKQHSEGHAPKQHAEGHATKQPGDGHAQRQHTEGHASKQHTDGAHTPGNHASGESRTGEPGTGEGAGTGKRRRRRGGRGRRGGGKGPKPTSTPSS